MNHNSPIPYLSIVTISRNDNYGGEDMFLRMQKVLRVRIEQLEKYKINSEIILVDWNPPADRPLLKEAIAWPSELKYCSIRSIVIPNSIHNSYDYSDRLNIIGIPALNCGIKRARGKFILPSHTDVIFSEALMKFIAAKELNINSRYRVARYDINRDVIKLDSLEEMLHFAENNIIRVRDFDKNNNKRFRLFKERLPYLFTKASGDFQLMSKKNWHKLRGYFEKYISGAYEDGILSYASYAAGINEIVLENPCKLYHVDHDGQFIHSIVNNNIPFQNILESRIFPKKIRNKLIDTYSRILVRSGYKLKTIVKNIPTRNYFEYEKLCEDIVDGKLSYVLNDINWGLGDYELEEFYVHKAIWELKNEHQN